MFESNFARTHTHTSVKSSLPDLSIEFFQFVIYDIFGGRAKLGKGKKNSKTKTSNACESLTQ